MRGIGLLRRHRLEFSAIAVVSDPTAERTAELYEFFAELGCAVLGVKIEEQEGVNVRKNDFDARAVTGFWVALAEAWRRNPVLKVREIERVLGYVAAEFDGRADQFLPSAIDPFPTVTHDGDVVLLSPELAGFTDHRGGDFAIGNVLRASPAWWRPQPASRGWRSSAPA